MAPNVTVSFFAANDINGSPILTIDDEDTFFKGLKLQPDLYGVGGWELTLARAWGFQLFNSGAIQPEVFVRFLVHAYSDTTWYYGGVLDKRMLTVVDREEIGAEELVIGGSGPKAYMNRSALGIEQRTGLGFNLDLENGVWRWNEAASAGRVLDTVVDEDAARSNPSLPDLTSSFNDTDDSDGNAWTNEVTPGPAEYQTPIGSSLLQVIWDLEDLTELFTTVNLGTVASPSYELEAWQSYGTDVSGSSFGPTTGLLREGVNIANDSLTVQGVGFRKATHVIVEGKDHVWVTEVKASWSPGDYVKWAKIEYSRSSNEDTLHRAGERWLRRQDNGDQQIECEIVPGASNSTGLYFPSPSSPIWLGNTIALDTVADGSVHSPLDYNNADQLVTALELSLGPAGDTTSSDTSAKSWDVKVKLNTERAGFSNSPGQGSPGTGSGDGGCNCPTPGPAPEPIPDAGGSVLHLWTWATDNVDTIDATSTAFRRAGTAHAWATADAVFGAGGVYGANAAGFYQTSALTVSAGTSYLFSTDIIWRFDPTFRGLNVSWYSDAGGNTLISEDTFVLGPGHATSTLYSESVTLVAPVGAIRCRVTDPHHFAGMFIDNLQMETVSTPIGQDPYAVNYGAFPHDSPYTLPSDYVEARLDANLAAIPGSLDELEDVDASAPTDGQVLTWNSTDEEWEAETLPASVPPTGTVGELLIADTGTSTPLVFADILQNEAQTDLMYADIG